MLDADQVAHERKLLVIERRNLAHLLAQAALYGGETEAPLAVMNNLHEVHDRIHTLKTSLRALGVTVEDAPGEQPAVVLPESSQSEQEPPGQIVLFAIGGVLAAIALITLVVALGGGFMASTPPMLSVRVVTTNGEPVPRANVSLYASGDIPVRETSDSNGNAVIPLDSGGAGRIVVEADGFAVAESLIDLDRDRMTTIIINAR